MKTTLPSCLIVASLVSASLAGFRTAVHAAALAEDSFESYSAGVTILGLSGGSGWAGPWTGLPANNLNAVDTAATPLSFAPAGGGVIQGGARAVELFAIGNQTNSRALAVSLPDTFYAAYLFRVNAGNWTDTDTFSVHFGNNSFNTSTPNFGLRGPNTFMVRTGTGAPGAASIVTGSTAVGAVNYLVARFSKRDADGNPTSTYDRYELWLNPAVDDHVTFPGGQAVLQLSAGAGPSACTHILVRIAALDAGDVVHCDQLIIAENWAEVINPVSAPLITGLAPVNGTIFWPAANGLSFQASSTAPIAPAGILLMLNGTNASAGLTIGGTPTERSVSFHGLATNAQYTAQVTVSNATGVSRVSLRFDTFSETAAVVVEAEDYNYDTGGDCDHGWGGFYAGVGGGFQTNPPPSGYEITTGIVIGGLQPDGSRAGYVDAVGLPEADFHDATTASIDTPASVYRFCDPVGVRTGREVRREKYVVLDLPEYDVFRMVAGDWMNYTRSFAPANYKVYLRAAGSAAGLVQLGKIAGDPSSVAQTVTPAGVFVLANTGGTNSYRYVPLTDASGQNEVTVTLAGHATVRLTSLGTDTNSVLNFLVFVPAGASLVPPVAEIRSPVEGAEFAAGEPIPITVAASDADGAISQITLAAATFNTTNVLGVFTTAPVNFTWTNATDADYTLLAFATDNDGLQAAAAPVRIKVGNPPAPALLVVGAQPLNAGDRSVFNRLASLGLPVVVKLATEITSEDANGKQLIVVSSTVLSGDLGSRLTAAATPVIQWEQALADEFLFSSAGSLLGGQQAIVITDEGAAHPLGAGLSAGTNVVRATGVEFHFASDVNLAPGAVVIARAATDLNPAPAILGVDTEAALSNGSPAPARRVFMFWGDPGLEGANAAGLALFDAAVQWALGRIPAGPALRITHSGGNVIVSWLASAAAEVLQESPDLANPTGWADSTRTVDNDGTTKSVTMPSPTDQRFFRLVRQ